MQLNKKLIIGISIAVLVSTAVITSVIIFTDKEIVTPPENIIIWGDEDFKQYNFPGSGTESEPYRIENLNITTSEWFAVYIGGTTSHSIIRNCFLKSTYVLGTGIQLSNVKIDTAVIMNNIISRKRAGIQIYDSQTY